MRIILKKPYIYFIVAIFLFYLLMNLFISGFYDTIPLILAYSKTVNWPKLLISIILSIAIALLISINLTYLYISYKQRKSCRAEATATSIATLGGLITGFCPLCVTGIFPILFGLFGVTFSLASLPFQGIEVQLGIIVLLIISYKMLTKNKNNYQTPLGS